MVVGQGLNEVQAHPSHAEKVTVFPEFHDHFLKKWVHAWFFDFYSCSCHIFRSDDKQREMRCLSENCCLVFLLVQKGFKNTNDCIFMVVKLLTGPHLRSYSSRACRVLVLNLDERLVHQVCGSGLGQNVVLIMFFHATQMAWYCFHYHISCYIATQSVSIIIIKYRLKTINHKGSHDRKHNRKKINTVLLTVLNFSS